MSYRSKPLAGIIVATGVIFAGPASATTLSYTGNFAADDDVQLFLCYSRFQAEEIAEELRHNGIKYKVPGECVFETRPEKLSPSFRGRGVFILHE